MCNFHSVLLLATENALVNTARILIIYPLNKNSCCGSSLQMQKCAKMEHIGRVRERNEVMDA